MILQFSIITFILSVVTEFFVIRFCHKHSLYDSLGSRKIHTGNIPRLGGIAIAVSFFLGFILYSISYHNKVNTEYIFLLISGLIIFTVGIIDDLIELSAKKKLLAQLIATIVLIIGGFKLNRIFIIDLDQNIYLKVLSYVVTFIGIVGVIVVIAICILPIIKLAVITIIYHMTAAICEPIADSKVISLISQMADTFKILLAILCATSVMMIIGVTLVINISNTGLMYR